MRILKKEVDCRDFKSDQAQWYYDIHFYHNDVSKYIDVYICDTTRDVFFEVTKFNHPKEYVDLLKLFYNVRSNNNNLSFDEIAIQIETLKERITKKIVINKGQK